MVALSISVEASCGLTWPLWKHLVSEVERLGFAGLYRADHFTVPFPANLDALELIVSLAYAAEHTERIPFGSLVAPLSFRDPVMLARQAAAIDDLSGGRMVLGVGAGWMEREHEMFGYELGDIPTRMDRLAEGLEVITHLLRDQEPVTYRGRHFHLQDAQLRPHPQRPGGPTLMVGGSGPRRTLPLVARYADIWNAQQLTPEGVRERSALLDTLLLEAGRESSAVKRTASVTVVCGRSETEMAERVHYLGRLVAPDDNLSVDDLLDIYRTQLNGIVGTPAEVIDGIRAYGDAGIEELMVQWFCLDDFEGLRFLAEHVAPHV